MRAWGFWIALVGGLLAPAMPALAANQTVTANSTNTFSPSTVTVTQGEMVTWNNTSGVHNVKFDDGSYTMPPSAQAAPWTVSRTFNNVGSFRYYCQLHGGPGGVGMSGIVNVTAFPYARPKSATPNSLRLVPAYKPCAVANGAHGAPLASPSCNPPVQTSDYLTVGTTDANGNPSNSTGSVQLKVVGENPIDPTNGDQANVLITASMTDVRRKASPFALYGGQLRGVLTLRITDRTNGPNLGDSATVTDAPFPFTIACASGNCNVSTSADTLMAGAAVEAKRSIWGLPKLEVFDGGADDAASTTGDNTLFAVPGLFAP
jgi:plastocyanin